MLKHLKRALGFLVCLRKSKLSTGKNDMTEDFKNSWAKVQATPDSAFRRAEYREVMDKASCWDLPATYTMVVRTEDPVSGLISEKVFTSDKEVKRFLRRCALDGHEATYYNNECMFSTLTLATADGEE